VVPLCSIVKEYRDASLEACRFNAPAEDGYDGDANACLGHRIRVCQDSIGNELPEYLVHASFVVASMAKFGFHLVDAAEVARVWKLPGGASAMFSSVAAAAVAAGDPPMTPVEQDVSFLNRYFIFRKDVDLDDVDKIAAALIREAGGATVARPKGTSDEVALSAVLEEDDDAAADAEAEAGERPAKMAKKSN
jgi:hypothetical protein